MSKSRSIKVLIVAENASSRFGGQAFLPLKYFELLRKRGHPAQLIAHNRNRDDLVAFLGDDIDGVHFVEDSIWHRMVWSLGKPMPSAIRDYVFGAMLNFLNELYQSRIINRLVRAGKVDLIHQPIPVSPRTPSSIYGFGVPVVIGPMNGGMTFPPGYEDFQGRSGALAIAAGRFLATIMNFIIPGKRRAALLLVANERTRRSLPVKHSNIVELVENGVDLATFTVAERELVRDERSLKLVFMGRLVNWKAVDLTLKAVAHARQAGFDVTLDILGDGEERAELETLAAKLGLDDVVRLHGYLSQDKCAAVMARADALILNSLYECGGAVVLEAMSLGLPAIASAWGGPADYLDDECGILVSPVPRADFPERLAQAIMRLASDPALQRRMGLSGAQKVRAHYDWEQKLDQIVLCYRNVLGQQDSEASKADGCLVQPPSGVGIHPAVGAPR